MRSSGIATSVQEAVKAIGLVMQKKENISYSLVLVVKIAVFFTV